MEDAATAIYNTCSSDVCPYIDHLDNPADMWRIPRKRLNTATPSTGRQAPYQTLTNSGQTGISFVHDVTWVIEGDMLDLVAKC